MTFITALQGRVGKDTGTKAEATDIATEVAHSLDSDLQTRLKRALHSRALNTAVSVVPAEVTLGFNHR